MDSARGSRPGVPWRPMDIGLIGGTGPAGRGPRAAPRRRGHAVRSGRVRRCARPRLSTRRSSRAELGPRHRRRRQRSGSLADIVSSPLRGMRARPRQGLQPSPSGQARHLHGERAWPVLAMSSTPCIRRVARSPPTCRRRFRISRGGSVPASPRARAWRDRHPDDRRRPHLCRQTGSHRRDHRDRRTG